MAKKNEVKVEEEVEVKVEEEEVEVETKVPEAKATLREKIHAGWNSKPAKIARKVALGIGGAVVVGVGALLILGTKGSDEAGEFVDNFVEEVIDKPI